MSENEKDKEIKKTSEAESYEEYEGEAIEDVEDVSVSEVTLPLDICQSGQNVTVSESDQGSEEGSSQDTYQHRRELVLREKWMLVTGKRPKNIPVVRKPLDENIEKYIFFGDKRPMEVEKNIRRRMLLAARKIENKGLKFGKVRQEIRLPALSSGILCVRFDPTAEYMACSNRKGGVEIRTTSTGEVIMNLNAAEQTEELAVRSVKYFPNDPEKLFVVGQIGSVQVFNTTTGEQLGASEIYCPVYTMDISANGGVLATGGIDGKIQVIDPHTLQVISRREWPTATETAQATAHDEYHRMRVYGMKFHSANLFATGSWDNTVKIWDVRTNAAIRSINGPAVHGDGLDIRDDVIITASWRVENSLNLWDFSSGKLIKNVPIKSKSTKFEGEFLNTCRFFKDDPAYSSIDSNMVAIGGSGFTDVIIINITTEKIVKYFPSFKPIMCLDVSGRQLVYGGMESVFRIAEV